MIQHDRKTLEFPLTCAVVVEPDRLRPSFGLSSSLEDEMPTRRASMRVLREVMRMYREGCIPVREIARLSEVAHI